MGWFNYYGLIAVAVILIPNILCMIFDRNAFENVSLCKLLTVAEQIGRYGCMIFMVFNIPYTWFGFWFPHALAVYLAVGGGLLLIYCLGWIIFGKGRGKLKMLWLSVMPSVLFLFCGVAVRSVLLLVFAAVFAVGHIAVSYRNANHL